MAARITENSFGTKKGAKLALKRIKKGRSAKFKWLMYRYWLQVYEYALQEVPVDTGALRASIRISRGGGSREGQFGVARALPGDDRWEYYITAGGYGVINPKKMREVDYAAAVHDGWVSRGGKYHPANPFLERAILRAEGEFQQMSKKMMDWVEEEWMDGNLRSLPPRGYHVPTRIDTGEG